MTMKTILILTAILFFSCSSPSEPEPQKFVNDPTGVFTPPPPGGTLSGTWRDELQNTVSMQGAYYAYYNVLMATDIRVSGTRVWFKAQGAAAQKTFSGVINGNRMEGFEQYSPWSMSQGAISPNAIPEPKTYIKVE
jgi:hypothetical protein